MFAERQMETADRLHDELRDRKMEEAYYAAQFKSFEVEVNDKAGVWGTLTISARDQAEAFDKARDFVATDEEHTVDLETLRLALISVN